MYSGGARIENLRNPNSFVIRRKLKYYHLTLGILESELLRALGRMCKLMLQKIFSYSPDNASPAISSEDDSDDDLPITAVPEMVLAKDNQQELTEMRNMLQEILSDYHQR
ncbi:hypothetical protein QE152_g38299 [Popillia japonica]|uniref:Uncharacterized protein n=1 Tax=Popillia japonica TaxID=7064 RepID=A0AAW1I6V5_POPJA